MTAETWQNKCEDRWTIADGMLKNEVGAARETPTCNIYTKQTFKDFKVELLYTVPRATQGSWVNICTLPQGQLLVSDQGGAGLFRIICLAHWRRHHGVKMP